MDDHLLNATYYSPELEEPHESTAMLGNIVHSDSPNHVETAASVGKSTLLYTLFVLTKKYMLIVIHTTYRKNNNHEKRAGIGLNGFIF